VERGQRRPFTVPPCAACRAERAAFRRKRNGAMRSCCNVCCLRPRHPLLGGGGGREGQVMRQDAGWAAGLPPSRLGASAQSPQAPTSTARRRRESATLSLSRTREPNCAIFAITEATARSRERVRRLRAQRVVRRCVKLSPDARAASPAYLCRRRDAASSPPSSSRSATKPVRARDAWKGVEE